MINCVSKEPWGSLAHTSLRSNSLNGRRSRMIRSLSGLWSTAKRPPVIISPALFLRPMCSGIKHATPLSSNFLLTPYRSSGATLKQPLVGDAGSIPWGIFVCMFLKVSSFSPFRWCNGSTMPASAGRDMRSGRTSLAILQSFSTSGLLEYPALWTTLIKSLIFAIPRLKGSSHWRRR